jgi:hypothetical protein
MMPFTLGSIFVKARGADGMERQNSSFGNNEDSTAGDVDVVERNFTARLLTGFMNEIGDAVGN